MMMVSAKKNVNITPIGNGLNPIDDLYQGLPMSISTITVKIVHVA